MCSCCWTASQLAEKVSSESALVKREQQIKDELNKKVNEQQQLLAVVDVIQRQKDELQGELC